MHSGGSVTRRTGRSDRIEGSSGGSDLRRGPEPGSKGVTRSLLPSSLELGFSSSVSFCLSHIQTI